MFKCIFNWVVSFLDLAFRRGVCVCVYIFWIYKSFVAFVIYKYFSQCVLYFFIILIVSDSARLNFEDNFAIYIFNFFYFYWIVL